MKLYVIQVEKSYLCSVCVAVELHVLTFEIRALHVLAWLTDIFFFFVGITSRYDEARAALKSHFITTRISK